jgi:hypothetical protein
MTLSAKLQKQKPLFATLAKVNAYVRADHQTRLEILAARAKSSPDDQLVIGLLRTIQIVHAQELAQARRNNPLVIELSYGQEDENGRWIRDNEATAQKGREYLEEQRAELEKKLIAIAQKLELNPPAPILPPPPAPEPWKPVKQEIAELRESVLALPEESA